MEGLCLSAVVDAPPNSIDLVDSKQHYTLAAESENEMLLWALVLRRCLARWRAQKPLHGGVAFSPDQNRKTSFIEQDLEDDPAEDGDKEGYFSEVRTPVPSQHSQPQSQALGCTQIHVQTQAQAHARGAGAGLSSDATTPAMSIGAASAIPETPASCNFFTDVPTPMPHGHVSASHVATTPSVSFLLGNANTNTRKTPYGMADTPGDEYFFKEVLTPAPVALTAAAGDFTPEAEPRADAGADNDITGHNGSTNFKDVYTPQPMSVPVGGSGSGRGGLSIAASDSPYSHSADGTPTAFKDVMTPFATATGAGTRTATSSTSTSPLVKTVPTSPMSPHSMPLHRVASPFLPISISSGEAVSDQSDTAAKKGNAELNAFHANTNNLGQDMLDAAGIDGKRGAAYNGDDNDEDDEDEDEVPYNMAHERPLDGPYADIPHSPTRAGILAASEPELNDVDADDDDDTEFLQPPAAEDSDPWKDVAGADEGDRDRDRDRDRENDADNEWASAPVAHTTQPLNGSGSSIKANKGIRHRTEDEEEDEELARLMPDRPSDLFLLSPSRSANSSSSSPSKMQPQQDITATSTLEAGYLANTTSIDMILNYPTMAAPTRYTESSANTASATRDRTTFNAPVAQWDLSDERTTDLPLSKQALLTCMPLKRVTCITSTNNMLVLQGRSVSTLITGTLKHVEIKSQLLVKDNTVLHMTRGAFAAGYLRKWPSATQSIGRQTKRYFILKDSLLRYYRQEPRTLDACVNDFMYRMNISAFSTVRRHTKYLLNCIRIHRNEDPDDILWVRVSNTDLDDSDTGGGSSGISTQTPPVTLNTSNTTVLRYGDLTAAELTHKEENKWIREIGNAILNCTNNGFNSYSKPFIGTFPAESARASPVRVPKISKSKSSSADNYTGNGKVNAKGKWEWSEVNGIQRDSNGEPITTTTASPVLTKTRVERRWYQDSNLYVACLTIDALSVPIPLKHQAPATTVDSHATDEQMDRMMLQCALYSYTRERHPLTNKLNPNGDFFVSVGAHWEGNNPTVASPKRENISKCTDIHYDLVGDLGRPMYVNYGLGTYLRAARLCYNNNNVAPSTAGAEAASDTTPAPAPEPARTELLVGGAGGRVGVALLDTTPFSTELAALASSKRNEKEGESIPSRKNKQTLRVIRCQDMRAVPNLLAESAENEQPCENEQAPSATPASAAVGHSRFSIVTAIAAATPPSLRSQRKGYAPVAVVSGDDKGQLVLWQRRPGYSYTASGAETELGGPLMPVMMVNLATAIGSDGASLVDHHDVSDGADYRNKRTASREESSEPESIVSIEFLTIDTSSTNPHYSSAAITSHGHGASEKRGRVAPLDVDSQFIIVTTSRRALIIAIRPPKLASVASPRNGLPPTGPTLSASASESASGSSGGIAANSSPVYTLRWVELDRVPTWGTRAVFSFAPVVTTPSYASSASSGNLAAMVGSLSGSYGSPHKESTSLKGVAHTPISHGAHGAHGGASPVNTPLRSEPRHQVQKTSLLTNSLSRPIYTFILWKVVEEDGRDNLVPITGKTTDARANTENANTTAADGNSSSSKNGANTLDAKSKIIVQNGQSSIANKPAAGVAASVGSGGTTPRERSGSIRHIDRLEGLGSPVVSDIAVGSLTMSHSFMSHSHSHHATSYTTGGHFFNAPSTSGITSSSHKDKDAAEKETGASLGSSYGSSLRGTGAVTDRNSTGNDNTEADDLEGEDEDMFELDSGEMGNSPTDSMMVGGMASSASSSNSMSPAGSLGTSTGSGGGGGFGGGSSRTQGSVVRVGGMQSSKKKMALMKIDSPSIIRASSFRGAEEGNEVAGSMAMSMANSMSAYNVMYPPSPVAFYDDSVTTVDTSENGTHTPLGTPRGNVIPFSARVGYFGGHASTSPVGTGLGYTGTGIKPPGAAAAIQREKAKNLTIFTGPVSAGGSSNTGAIVTHPTNTSHRGGVLGASSLMEPNWRLPQSVQGIAVVRASNEAAARALQQGFFGNAATPEKMKPRSSVRNSNNNNSSSNSSGSGAVSGNTGGTSAEKRELSFSFGPKGGGAINPSGIEELSAPPSGIVRHRCFRSEITEAQLMSILTTKMKPL